MGCTALVVLIYSSRPFLGLFYAVADHSVAKKGLKNWRPQWQIEATTHKDSTMTYVDAYSYSSTSSCFFPISSRQALYQYQLVFRLRSTDSHTCFEGGVRRAFTQLVNKTSALQGGSSLCDSVKVFLLNVSNNSWNLRLVELHNECYISTLECGVGIRIQTNRYAEKVSTKSNQSFQNCQF